MLQLACAVRALWYAMLLIAFGLGAPVGLAQAQGSSTRADVAELLKKHDEALNQHNLAGLLALYASSPKTGLLGTYEREKDDAKEQTKAAHTEIFKDLDKGTMTHSWYWKEGGGSGNMVWGAAMCKLSDAKGEKKREYELNVSTVMQKQGGKWQLVLLHYSNVVGNAPN